MKIKTRPMIAVTMAAGLVAPGAQANTPPPVANVTPSIHRVLTQCLQEHETPGGRQVEGLLPHQLRDGYSVFPYIEYPFTFQPNSVSGKEDTMTKDGKDNLMINGIRINSDLSYNVSRNIGTAIENMLQQCQQLSQQQKSASEGTPENVLDLDSLESPIVLDQFPLSIGEIRYLGFDSPKEAEAVLAIRNIIQQHPEDAKEGLIRVLTEVRGHDTEVQKFIQSLGNEYDFKKMTLDDLWLFTILFEKEKANKALEGVEGVISGIRQEQEMTAKLIARVTRESGERARRAFLFDGNQQAELQSSRGDYTFAGTSQEYDYAEVSGTPTHYDMYYNPDWSTGGSSPFASCSYNRETGYFSQSYPLSSPDQYYKDQGTCAQVTRKVRGFLKKINNRAAGIIDGISGLTPLEMARKKN